ncbi:cobalt-precorrin-8 methylmutase [Acerihabitans arboris]|uniref:Cobalt-precorrin-8 methylmutase n=1 Tax=Acerihabitans arboris TaxID=2691583 RepID=A0A845SJK3_9GAMM|nr:cobalt-precorrin-8 methylmutase [Acerihabitans arboris]NDL63186.1 cobalt-precorrin-8 methylmutase [Acerihabitans arboris]
MSYIKQPQEIERTSFDIIREIIARERPDFRFQDIWQEKIILRAIHTSADFDWLDILHFSAGATGRIADALSRGCTLYTDTTMALSGINKTELARIGGTIACYIGDAGVAELARAQGITRSMAAVDYVVDLAGRQPDNSLFVFGNAPTALFRLLEHCAGSGYRPQGVIGVPVGFVGASESKQALADSPLPCIAALGRKGGSNIAAAIVNAILYQLREA